MNNEKDIFKELPLGRHWAILSKVYVGALTKKLEALDIERHYSLLIVLHNKPDCNQKCLTEILRIDKASLVRVIDHLSKKGYVKRVINPSDRREHYIRLTPKAEKVIPVITKAVRELNAVALKGLSKSGVELFYDTLRNAQDNLNKEPLNKVMIHYKKMSDKNEKR